jgi:hypothetical protein
MPLIIFSLVSLDTPLHMYTWTMGMAIASFLAPD